MAPSTGRDINIYVDGSGDDGLPARGKPGTSSTLVTVACALPTALLAEAEYHVATIKRALGMAQSAELK